MENEFNKLTLEKIEDALRTMLSPYRKYTDMMVFGFMPLIQHNDIVWIVTGDITQDGKRIILIKPGSKVHKVIKELEQREHIHFDRLNEATMKLLNSKIACVFSDEDGVIKTFEYEPMFFPYPFDYDAWAKTQTRFTPGAKNEMEQKYGDSY